jgi:GT2 family glycosyltransferase
MKILISCLTYGTRPTDILYRNIAKAGYPATYIDTNVEGIANAQNQAVDAFKDGGYHALGFLANDIEEPEGWLRTKLEALINYPEAGIVATPLDCTRNTLTNEHVIGNWLMSKAIIDKVGYFNESMFPYGPVDLDYLERAWAAEFKTYYALNALASHTHPHASGNEYGYDKSEMVAKYWGIHVENAGAYRNGSLSYKRERQ